jgi:hypothetical protein
MLLVDEELDVELQHQQHRVIMDIMLPRPSRA